jgi:hypothetical protein
MNTSIKEKKNFTFFFLLYIALKKCPNLQDLWHLLKGVGVDISASSIILFYREFCRDPFFRKFSTEFFNLYKLKHNL